MLKYEKDSEMKYQTTAKANWVALFIKTSSNAKTIPILNPIQNSETYFGEDIDEY